MELIAELVNNQFTSYIPVALVLVALTLLFTFGFKSAEQPPFDKLSAVTDDRKTTAKKQRKVKEKKSANGNAVPVSESKNEKSKEAKLSPSKETPNTPKQTKKQEPNSPKTVVDKKKVEVKVKKTDLVEEKNKKNLKQTLEKPVDYDDGNWETVPSKNDKKKKQDSPKKEKKTKPEKDGKDSKVSKEEDNKENKVEIISKEEIVEKKGKQEEKVEKVDVKAPISELPMESKKIEKSTEVNQSLAPAFDELGDVWTEAKAAKKSKKKSRREN